MQVKPVSGKKQIFTICGFMFLVLLRCDVLAQTETKARLTGFIVDRFGASIEHVAVTARDAKGKAYEVKSDWRGAYTVELPQALYSISFKCLMYTTLEIKNYQIPHAGTLHLDVGLFCDGCTEVNTLNSQNRGPNARLRKKNH